jgi:hypothetical protein
MPLIDLNPQPPAPPSKEQRLAQQVKQMRQGIAGQWSQLQRTFNDAAKFVWANPNFTPQEVFDAFGTDAVDLCKISNAYLAMVESYTGVAGSVVPKGKSLVLNADGTVKVV